MGLFVEPKPAPMPVGFHCPAGQAACDFFDIVLVVAAVDTQRVQLHQLTGIVLVGDALAVRRVVEVAEHGG